LSTRETALHINAAAAVANRNHVAVGSSVLDRIRFSLAPILILYGRRDAAKIAGDVFDVPQRPGKALITPRRASRVR
jgi:hypothetical protein